MASDVPSALRMSMNPPPPMLPAEGQVTARASETATAASTALPPFFMMSAPMREAISLVEATIACRACTGAREAAVVGSANARLRRTAVTRFMACNRSW